MKRYFDTVILGLGIFFLGFSGYLYWERHTERPLVFAQTEPSTTVLPVRLLLPTLGIELPIHPAMIEDGKWDITREGVSYLLTSPLPGTQGNAVIYGHNWTGLLGPLKNIKSGDEIIVEDSKGTKYTYIVHFISTVTPDQSHIYSNTSDYRLTLYTCTGFLDSKRLVVTAILQ